MRRRALPTSAVLGLLALLSLPAPSAAAMANDTVSPDGAPATHMPNDRDLPGMNHGMEGMSMRGDDPMNPMNGRMTGILGPYPMAREASGTSWQPDTSVHGGIESIHGDWMVMAHALLNGVYDWQQGPRGGTDVFASGMVMGMAERQFAGGDALQLRAMVSPDPLMGRSGYPLLLASGETSNGETPLIDRQHPHNLIMELAGTVSHAITAADSVFLYAALPGEPAFGPPAFMHRQSIMDSPEAPITHHWLDSTHITDGVVTVGIVHDDWKVEASRFHGREPDQFRYAVETGTLDSTSARVSWNPVHDLALQASWAKLVSPEQLDPTRNQSRFSASGIYTKPLGQGMWWSTTVAWGRRRSTESEPLNAYLVESAVKPVDEWTLFARAERERNDELVAQGPLYGARFVVGKVSAGVIRDFRVIDRLKVGLGALYAFNFVTEPLAALYGGSDPQGAMAFIRLKVD